jgi:hypothetical protein
LARFTHDEDPDQLLRYIDARAGAADRQAKREASDPDELAARATERRLLRLLVVMVAIIVAGGFIISLVGIMLNLPGAH